MQPYIALLRGINVSGKNQVRMSDLVRVCENLGFAQAKTYLASGNVVFQAAGGLEALEKGITAQIAQELGLDVTVLVREAADFAGVLAGNPFDGAQGEEAARWYVTFLQRPAAEAKLAALAVPPGESAQFAVRGGVIYLSCPNGYGRTKLSNAYFERKLGVPATTRNWSTVRALAAMAAKQ